MHGGRSSVGRALDCGSSGRGFKSRRSPHFFHVKGEVAPTVDTLLKIAAACQINPQELLPEEVLLSNNK